MIRENKTFVNEEVKDYLKSRLPFIVDKINEANELKRIGLFGKEMGLRALIGIDKLVNQHGSGFADATTANMDKFLDIHLRNANLDPSRVRSLLQTSATPPVKPKPRAPKSHHEAYEIAMDTFRQRSDLQQHLTLIGRKNPEIAKLQQNLATRAANVNAENEASDRRGDPDAVGSWARKANAARRLRKLLGTRDTFPAPIPPPPPVAPPVVPPVLPSVPINPRKTNRKRSKP